MIARVAHQADIRPPRRRRGHTLLELVAASTVLALTLVPALRILRDALSQSRANQTYSLLTSFCVSKLEEYACLASASWTNGTASGNFSPEGYAGYKYSVARSDAAGDGGVANRLMSITATVWSDDNGDGSWGTGEPRIVFSTKVSKLAKYQSEAGGS